MQKQKKKKLFKKKLKKKKTVFLFIFNFHIEKLILGTSNHHHSKERCSKHKVQ